MPQDDPRILELRTARQRARQGGGADRMARQRARGKLSPRDRLDLLIDPGTFHELEPFITHQGDEMGLSRDRFLGDGVVTGYGQIDGRTIHVYAQDFTVYGGTLSEMQSHKIRRVMDLALRNGTPIIGLIDSGGARIPEGVKSLGGYAEILRRNAQYSGVIPQISVMLGPCAGGAAYSPALTDLIIMVDKHSYMFLTGPQVIRAVTGEVVDVETLGGAELHMSLSGTAHLATATEPEALSLCRTVLGYLPSNNVENPPYLEPADDPLRMDEELDAIVPLEPTTPYSMHEVIQRVTDRDSFLEIQPDWARNAVVGLARMGGHSVGIVAQEPSVMAGVIEIDAADKITRFVRMCDCFNLPLVTFVDSPGFLPGVDQEHRGIIRHGAKVLYAYSEATVPKISVITCKAYGGAYVVMSSKYLGTDVNYAWPSAEIAVMGAEGAANILFKEQIEAAADPTAEQARPAEEYRLRFNNPYHAASDGYVDDIIEPRETRPKIIATLAALRDKYAPAPPRKHGNIPVWAPASTGSKDHARPSRYRFADYPGWHGVGLRGHSAAVAPDVRSGPADRPTPRAACGRAGGLLAGAGERGPCGWRRGGGRRGRFGGPGASASALPATPDRAGQPLAGGAPLGSAQSARAGAMKFRVRIGGREFAVEVGDLRERPVRVQVDGKELEVWPEQEAPRPSAAPRPAPLKPAVGPGPARAGPAGESARAVRAPIPGVITSIAVQPGSSVTVGQEECILEAMKMKNAIRASRAGTVASVHVVAGQHVRHNDLLLELSG